MSKTWCTCSRSQPCQIGVGRLDRQVEIVDEPVQLVVAHHVGQAGPQAVAGLALDLVDVGDDAVEPAVRA